jgi:hypothetical protein
MAQIPASVAVSLLQTKSIRGLRPGCSVAVSPSTAATGPFDRFSALSLRPTHAGGPQATAQPIEKRWGVGWGRKVKNQKFSIEIETPGLPRGRGEEAHSTRHLGEDRILIQQHLTFTWRRFLWTSGVSGL